MRRLAAALVVLGTVALHAPPPALGAPPPPLLAPSEATYRLCVPYTPVPCVPVPKVLCDAVEAVATVAEPVEAHCGGGSAIRMAFAGGQYTVVDPPGFACVNGGPGFHNPPLSFERRCAPPPSATSGSCQEAVLHLGVSGQGGAALGGVAFCDFNTALPPGASCQANVGPTPGVAACSDGPAGPVVTLPYTLVCHLTPAGPWQAFEAECSANMAYA